MSIEPPIVLPPPPRLQLCCDDGVWIAAVRRQVARQGKASNIFIEIILQQTLQSSLNAAPLLLETKSELTAAMTLVATIRHHAPDRVVVALVSRQFAASATADEMAIRERALKEAGASAILTSPSDVESVRRVISRTIELAESNQRPDEGLPKLPVGWHTATVGL